VEQAADHMAVRLGMMVRLISLALPDKGDFEKDGVWSPLRVPEFLMDLQLCTGERLQSLFGVISDSHSVHYACIRGCYFTQQKIMRPYKAILFPDPGQPAKKCISKQLADVVAVIRGWTSLDWSYLVNESVVPSLLKAARRQK
jgi:hypothetical protein